MPRSRELGSFVVTFVALSVALAWMFWNLSVPLGAEGRLPLSDAMPVSSAVAAILAARGFGWRRKVVYALITSVGYSLAIVVSVTAGLAAFVGSELNLGQPYPSVWSLLYITFLATFPIVMLVLFVGRTPARLWTRGQG